MKEKLLAELKSGLTKVSFVKKDGSTREMVCTLDFEIIPEDKTPKGEESGKILSDEVICVFDVENDGWRSFRVDSIISFSKDV